jgi:hypothetical protein
MLDVHFSIAKQVEDLLQKKTKARLMKNPGFGTIA